METKISHQSELRHALTEKLDQRTLVRLTADLLSTRRHKKIRLTDGPGDGGRDIHSVSSTNESHLTQCKYHDNPNQACSSAEVSELPMAMTKFGYKHGLFVTNAKISPQAKREYLNDYPGLELDFLDGEELAREVLSNGVLTGLWWEGSHFSQVSISTVFPMIIRLHQNDLPLSPFDSSTAANANPFFEYLSGKHPHYRFSLQSGTSSTEPFEPYRYPEPLTMEEGSLPFLRVIELAITGDVAFAQFSTLSESICKATCAWLLPEHDALSVRVGRPEIVPLQGANAGKRILTDVGATSFTATSCFCGDELSWFSAESESWSADSDARVSEAPWIRLYSQELNCALSYEIETRVSSARRRMDEALREISLQGWNASVFCLVPRWEEWLLKDIPEPDETVEWPWDGRILCGWHHWSILGGGVPIRSGRTSPSPFHFPDEEATRTRLTAIREFLSGQRDCQILDATNARHMVALAGNDPFPDMGFSTVDTADVVYYPETLPSPILPAARRFGVTLAWRSTINYKDAESDILEILQSTASDFQTSAWCSQREEYLCMQVAVVHKRLDARPTARLLSEIHDWLRELLPEIENRLRIRGGLDRATKELWASRFDVNFGMRAEDSDKCYVGTFNPDGSIEKLNQKIFLEEGFEAAIREREESKRQS